MASNEPFDNQQLAKNACAYSREQIREGATQLQNNFYDLHKQQSLIQALSEIRNAVIKDEFFLNVDNAITRFEKRIADCKKFSLGNCYELALMALDYMIRNHPNVSAEAYSVQNGDHAFLVIGRDPNSDPNKPETWGDDAYICDPWANEVYPAKEYLEKTKGYYYTKEEDGRVTNHVQDFDPDRHQMNPIQERNNREIIQGSQKLNDILLRVFSSINTKHCDIFDELANDLEKTAKEMTKKYGEHDPKVKIINEKIGVIREKTEQFRAEFHDYAEQIKKNPADYQSHKEINDNMQHMMRSQMKTLRQAASLSTEEYSNLNQYRNKGSLVTMIMKFLNIAPSSCRQYKSAVEKTESQISDFSERVNTAFGKS